MIELTNVNISLDAYAHDARKTLHNAAAAQLGVSVEEVSKVRILKKSVDARKKSDVHFVMTLGVSLLSEKLELNLISESGVDMQGHPVDAYPAGTTMRGVVSNFLNARFYGSGGNTNFKLVRFEDPEVIYSVPSAFLRADYQRPVVVGAGPAGLFAALYLTYSGLQPLLIERGASVDERVSIVEAFNTGGDFNPITNIQFGEGGAGTFSDGKLTTNTKSPLTKMVLNWFVDAGAPKDILVDAKPHIGTDKLRGVVKSLTETIRHGGGEVRFNTKLVDFHFEEGALTELVVEDTQTNQRETIAATQVILAIGHSARDTFELIKRRHLVMERKPFSVGVRIEHPQSLINEAQYGPFANHPALAAADYKLSTHLENGRGVYTFCMCPGGQVVAATSEAGGVVVNGMSEFARDADNANSAVLVSVEPADFPGDDVLAGVEFQRQIERSAYQLALKNGGAPYSAPAQRVGDFLKHSKSDHSAAQSKPIQVNPSYARGVAWSDLHECLPSFVSSSLEQALPIFDKKLHGFAHPDAIMTGVETRSSSPVRISRNNQLQASFSDSAPAHKKNSGVFPCGEGAGYAGGIMSAAVDGIRVAKALIKSICIIDLEDYQRKKGEGSLSPKESSAYPKDDSKTSAPVSASLDEKGGQVSKSCPADNKETGKDIRKAIGSPVDYFSPSGDFYQYQRYTDGEAAILKCIPAGSRLVMPSVIGNLVVTELDSGVFDDKDFLTELVLPTALSRLSHRCFSALVNLKKLTLSAGFSNFDTRVLSALKSLETLKLPDMMVKIPTNIFTSCSPKEIIVGRNTQEVADGAFASSTLERIWVVNDNPYLESDGLALYDKKRKDLVALAARLENYEIRPGCQRIRRKAFATNTAIRKVFFPDSVKVIERFAFFRSGILEFKAPKYLKSIGLKAFCQCTSLRDVRLNEGLTFVGDEAFLHTALDELTLPATIEQLGFAFCNPIARRGSAATPKVSIAPGPSLFVIDENQALYKRETRDACNSGGLTLWSFLDQDAKTFQIREGCTAIAPSACVDKKNLTYIELPKGIDRIGDYAFRGCSNLRYIGGSERLESIGSFAFLGTQITDFYLPETFKECVDSAFVLKESSTGMIPEMIPNLTVHPDNPVFYIKNNFLCRKVDSENIQALYCFEKSSHVVVPPEVTMVGAYGFAGAVNVDTIEIHDGIQSFTHGCTRCPHFVKQIIVKCLNHPIENHSQFRLSFPDSPTGRDAIRYALEKNGWNVIDLVQMSDEAIYWSREQLVRAQTVVERLSDPIYLTEKSQNRFTTYCESRLVEIAELFVRFNYLRGLKLLVQLGYLNENTIGMVIERANMLNNTEIMAYLLEFRRRVCHFDVMSEYDI